ncbi:hypothetical protein Taro_015834, partial [Colocasia esculenta]|nr:hypothetical protein [Colocasia esculenta]
LSASCHRGTTPPPPPFLPPPKPRGKTRWGSSSGNLDRGVQNRSPPNQIRRTRDRADLSDLPGDDLLRPTAAAAAATAELSGGRKRGILAQRRTRNGVRRDAYGACTYHTERGPVIHGNADGAGGPQPESADPARERTNKYEGKREVGSGDGSRNPRPKFMDPDVLVGLRMVTESDMKKVPSAVEPMGSEPVKTANPFGRTCRLPKSCSSPSMEDFSAPSFSLGLDLDLDLVVDPDLSTEEEPDGGDGGRRGYPEEEECSLPGPSASGHQSWRDIEEDGTDFVLETLEEEPPLSPPPLKRLRRGPPQSRAMPEAPQRPLPGPSTPAPPVQRFTVVDDAIEVVSSQEDCVVRDEYSLRQDRSACSSSKFLLHERRVLPTPYARKSKTAKIVSSSNGSVPISSESNNYKRILRRFPTSPLRRIQLMESDLDDLHGDEHKDVIEVNACHEENWFASAQSVAKAQQKTKVSSGKLQAEDLLKDSLPKKNINLATPAFDDCCQEYFKVAKSSNIDQRIKGQTSNSNVCASYVVDGAESHHEESHMPDGSEHYWNLPDPQPPSYQYFYHTDVRIQKLVRQRLPNFVPLGDAKCIQNQQPNAATIDYMSQFDQGNAPFQVCGGPVEGNSKSKSTTQKNTKNKKVIDTSGPWVNPRSRAALQKGAGKSVAHTAGRSTGHWYTGQDGRKVNMILLLFSCFKMFTRICMNFFSHACTKIHIYFLRFMLQEMDKSYQVGLPIDIIER